MTNYIAANHVVSGERVPWKIVPAVTDVFRAQWRHIHSPRPVCHASSATPHAGHTKPSGHRSPAR